MRRAALSHNVLNFPAQPAKPAVTLEIVRGRQQTMRHGIFFAPLGKQRRSFYMQFNGEPILADECKCAVDWIDQGGFEVQRYELCPIDEHKALILKAKQEAEGD
jgi:hypothetical protein